MLKSRRQRTLVRQVEFVGLYFSVFIKGCIDAGLLIWWFVGNLTTLGCTDECEGLFTLAPRDLISQDRSSRT